ncbi:MAG: hypothetical protein NVSMB1_08540 [Polyangiales bacterium]
MLSARLDAPSIGTRDSATASLTVRSATDPVRYLGCDIKYFNMPAGAKIKLIWNYYEGEDDLTPDNKSSGKEQEVHGSDSISSYLQSPDGRFEPGIYECKWSVENARNVLHSPSSARITVLGKKSKSKATDDDDDDDDNGVSKK